jgi:hypothetical protein
MEFPTLFAMAMDYIAIQATSVPCERVFSSAKETDTAKRNQINPILMEALQMLKFSLKKERIDFMAGWSTSETDLKEIYLTHQLQSLLVGDDRHNALDGILNNLVERDEK